MFCGGKPADARCVVAWDSMANVTFGRHYGFIEREQDVDGLIEDSVNSMRYFAPVSEGKETWEESG